jgi:uncharacterized membrane protein YcfT
VLVLFLCWHCRLRCIHLRGPWKGFGCKPPTLPLACFFRRVMRGAVLLVVNSRVGIPFKVHIVCGCAGFEVLIDVLAHMFDRGVGFFLASCVRGRILRLEMLSHNVYGHFVVSIVYALVVQRGGGLLNRWCGLSRRRISRWNASTPLLCVEVAVGENYSSSGR